MVISTIELYRILRRKSRADRSRLLNFMRDILVTTRLEFEEALGAIRNQTKIVVDVETSGLNLWLHDRICGVGVCLENRDAFYFPFRHVKANLPLLAMLDDEEINLPLDWLQELWEAIYQVETVIGHNIKFDLAAMFQDGFDLKRDQKAEDTIVGARLFFKGRYDKLSLEHLSDTLLGKDPWKKDFQAYLKSNGWQHHFDYAHPTKIAPYAIGDVRRTFDSRDEVVRYILNTGQERVWKQECELIRESLWEMEKRGLFYDLEYCEDRIPKMKKRLAELEELIYAVLGKFDIASNPQLNEKMNKIGIYAKGKTAKGDPQWDQGELLTMEHPIGGLLLEWRGIEKQRSVYFEPLLLHKATCRVHPSFKSWGTITGRISCENPNLQNLTKGFIDLQNNDMLDDEAMAAIKAKLSVNKAGQDTGGASVATGTLTGFMSYGKKYDDMDPEFAIATRRLYIPPPGFQLYMIDFSQMEMRVFADYVNDPVLNAMLEDTDSDFHDIVAMEVWHVDKSSSMWSFYRTMAKCINFGLLYGIGIKKLAGQMQCTEEEAKEFRVRYFQRFPKAERFMKDVNSRILQRGYVTNRFGRRYYIDADDAYRGVNYLIQGTSADIVKNRMIDVSRFLRDHDSDLIVQVHDELVFYVADHEEHWIVKKLKEIIEERCIKTFLPTEVTKGFPSWAQKKDVCANCMGLKEKENHDCNNSVSVLAIQKAEKKLKRKFKLEEV